MSDPRYMSMRLPGHLPLQLTESEGPPDDDYSPPSATGHARQRSSTPLLSSKVEKMPTPFPMPQMILLLVLAVAEPIHATQIYPYLAQLVGEIGVTRGDSGKIGYYAGLIDTAYFFTESCFVLQWARTSDRVGRRPVLLCGVAGISLSAMCFGLSSSFPGLVMSRALAGVLNANFAVLRGAMADILDASNFARGIAWMPIMWSIGATVGPLVGGSLSHPYERMPGIFGGDVLWKRHPYLLPCLFSATVSISAFVLASLFLEETLPSHKKRPSRNPGYQLVDSPSIASVPGSAVGPPPLSSLLTPPLIIILINYAIFSLLEVSFNAVVPLFLAAPLSLGGLGFTPSMIGICLATIGLFNGFVQIMYFARIHALWGSKRMLRNGMLAYATIFSLFPVVNWLARRGGAGFFVAITMIIQAMLVPTAMMVSSCITILLTNATSPSALGAANGLAQTTASFLRALGPAGATALLAVSVDHNIAGGSFVFYVEAAVALAGFAASGLVKEERQHDDNDHERCD